jgi:amino acid transporter
MMLATDIKTNYDVLVYAALALFVLVVMLSVLMLARTKPNMDPETCRFRLTAAMFIGILMLFVFCASLYYATPEGYAGREIFDKGLLVMATLAGSIVGYYFGSARNDRQGAAAPEVKETARMPPKQAEPARKVGT